MSMFFNKGYVDFRLMYNGPDRASCHATAITIDRTGSIINFGAKLMPTGDVYTMAYYYSITDKNGTSISISNRFYTVKNSYVISEQECQKCSDKTTIYLYDLLLDDNNDISKLFAPNYAYNMFKDIAGKHLPEPLCISSKGTAFDGTVVIEGTTDDDNHSLTFRSCGLEYFLADRRDPVIMYEVSM